MPNYCENDLAVEGPRDVIEEFIKFAAGESPFDFNKFVPYPENSSGWMMRSKLGTGSTRERTIKKRHAAEDGYSTGGRDWCVSNWGTKWPACDVEVGEPAPRYGGKTWEIVLHFKTPWSPPTPVIAKAAERYRRSALTFAILSAAAVFTEYFVATAAKSRRTQAASISGAEADELPATYRRRIATEEKRAPNLGGHDMTSFDNTRVQPGNKHAGNYVREVTAR